MSGDATGFTPPAQPVAEYDLTGTGTIAALNGAVIATTDSFSTVTFVISGTWVGSLFVQASNNGGVTYTQISGYDVNNGVIITNTSSNIIVNVPCAGWGFVQLIMTSYTSGTASITWEAAHGSSVLQIYNQTAASLQATARINDGIGNAITSTSINGKQRLDTDSQSEGTDGAAAPFGTTQIGGKDPSGNLQAFNVDINGNLFTSDKIPLTPSSPSAVSVGVTSGVVIATNANRKGLILTNTSTGIISLNIVGGTAVSKSGIVLYPGGHWEMDEYTFTTDAINGISTVAASNLAIQELST